jgi:hypothetical protein
LIDATTGRQLAPGLRRIMTDDAWQWITSNVDGQHDHLLIASSLPFPAVVRDASRRGVGGGRRRLPDDAPPTRTPIWQIVCSGIRNELKIREPATLHLGHTRLAAALGRALVSTTRVGTPRLRWRPVTRPHFQNQIGTLEIADGEVGVRIEQVAGSWRKPRLLTVTEHKLL